MKKSFFLIICLLPILAFAQFNLQVGEGEQIVPVKWSTKITEEKDNQYTITVTAIMEENYHIWDLDAGGDGTLINTEISIAESNNIKVVTPFAPIKQPKIVNLEYIEGAVRWHEKKIVFTGVYTISNKEPINVDVTYQACNYEMCFPPEDIQLKISL